MQRSLVPRTLKVTPRSERGRLDALLQHHPPRAFTPRQMFDLVADVEKYPQFLPLCEELVVRKREQAGDKQVLIADMTVGYKAIRETFTSRVTLDPAALPCTRAACRSIRAGRSSASRTDGASWRRPAAATSASTSPTSSSR